MGGLFDMLGTFASDGFGAGMKALGTKLGDNFMQNTGLNKFGQPSMGGLGEGGFMEFLKKLEEKNQYEPGGPQSPGSQFGQTPGQMPTELTGSILQWLQQQRK